MRLRATVTPTVGALCPFGKARFTSPAIENASASGKFPDVRFCEGFRMPAHEDDATYTGAGVRKPPKEETAGRDTSDGAACAIEDGVARNFDS